MRRIISETTTAFAVLGFIAMIMTWGAAFAA